MRTGSALLTNAVGRHARPSVKLTQLAKSFTGTVEFAVTPDGTWTDAKSPVKVMRVRAAKGATIHVRTQGPDADAALAAVIGLIQRQFDED